MKKIIALMLLSAYSSSTFGMDKVEQIQASPIKNSAGQQVAAIALSKGNKDQMQDCCSGCLSVDEKEQRYVVCDGHGLNGKLVADFALEEFSKNCTLAGIDKNDAKSVVTACEEGFRQADKAVKEYKEAKNVSKDSEVSMLAAFLDKDKIVIANAGVNALLYGNGERLSGRHILDIQSEQDRIRNANGKVLKSKSKGYYYLLNAETASRYNYTRALGVTTAIGQYVIPDPEVTVTNREASHEFLVLATKGLLNGVKRKRVGEIVRKALSEKPGDYTNAAETLVRTANEAASKKGDIWNTALIIVALNNIQK
jgi:serine/threonine protein phosphatase PrpC